MKYPPLQEPCRSCLGCIRLEDPTFTKDENCRYREKKAEFKNIEWKQEAINQCMEYGTHTKKSFNLE